jgi:ABC-2 type transport system permease protein
MLRHSLLSSKRETLFKTGVICSFLVLLWLGAFSFFYRGLKYLDLYPGIGTLLRDRAVSLLLAAAFFMLIISFAITVYSGLYRGQEVNFLSSLPLSRNLLFTYKFIESFILSSWAVLFLITPFILAYGLIIEPAADFYLYCSAIVLALVVLAGFFGAGLVVLLMRLLCIRYFRRGLLLVISLVVLSLPLLWRLGTLPPERPRSLQALYLFNRILHHTSFAQFPLLPNYWASQGILAWGQGDYHRGVFFLLVLASNCLFLSYVTSAVVSRWYLPGLSFSWRGLLPRRHREGYLDRILKRTLSFLRPHISCLVVKDIKTFFRDPLQWSQFAIFFGLIGVYVLNLRTLPFELDSPLWRNTVTFLNLGATALTMAMLQVRFVFPLLSLEGKRFWILGLAPLKLKELLLEKFFLSLAGSLVITELLVIGSCLMLKVSWTMTILSAGTILVMCLAISGLSVGMGAIFPNFKEDNPAAIVSGFGGTLLLILSLFYVGTIISLEATVLYWYLSGQLTQEGFRAMLYILTPLVLIISLLTCLVPLGWGYRRLEEMEF